MIQFLMSRRFSDYYAKNRQIIQEEPQKVKDSIAEMSAEERLAAIKRYKMIIETLENDDD